MLRFNFGGRIAKEGNINICREDVTLIKDGQEKTITDAFIVVFTKDNFLDKKNINPLFENIRGSTYRGILDPRAGLAEITAFGNAIKELDCANRVDKEFKKLVNYSTNTPIGSLVVEIDEKNFKGPISPLFKKTLEGNYCAVVKVNAGLSALTELGNALSQIENANHLFQDLDSQMSLETYTPPSYKMT